MSIGDLRSCAENEYALPARSAQTAEPTKQVSDLADLPLAELQAISGHIEKDVFDVPTVDGSMAACDLPDGTAPKRVRARAAFDAFEIA